MTLTGFTTFTEVVRERARTQPHHDALIFLHDDDSAKGPEHLTYGALDAAARSVAVRLRDHGAQGQPVLLLHPQGPEFLKAFIGCLYAGAVAVPAPLPGDRGERLHRVSGILRDCGARLVLTDQEHAPDISLWLAMSGLGEAVCMATDVDEADGEDTWRPPHLGPDDLAVLQYTSGPTSEPRGVMISHRNLLANQIVLQRMLRTTPADRLGGWLPHHHDMGLVAQLLHPLWLGGCGVRMSSASFVAGPARWLRSFQDYGVTVGGGPDFAYDLCVRRVTDAQLAELDLSGWRLALGGTEPVRPATLEAFAERFAPAGFRREALYPGYGLAESTLVVSGGTPGLPYLARDFDPDRLAQGELRQAPPGGPARTLVAAGRPVGCDLRIVDPVDGSELPPGRVGEIWLRGDSVAQGYWQRPEETARSFHAVLDSGEGGFLRTGDLGVLDANRLYVTGRLKDVLTLGGRTIHPQDVEGVVREAGPALGAGSGAVFTVDAEREHLVVVHEVRAAPTDGERLRTLARRIQTLVGQDFEVPAGNVVLVRPGSVRRTTSGKARRQAVRELFLAGEMESVHETLTPDVRALVRPEHTLLGHDLLQSTVPVEQDLAW
ncbi:fatty acyl-AMP ligase [Streptomyces sp. NA04227]|uniref:fatty acyl-AMP ligase n=1 Tax=Streptomyces sp. NA04227 TaxID=2742136 RepID=UPI0015929823|nr:fatty acyl-AMP ligase [Streptomyces sp. NA04227]QKW05091.1 fatty acyl-AMP ligase [Streptomyces sp. NA04227]